MGTFDGIMSVVKDVAPLVSAIGGAIGANQSQHSAADIFHQQQKFSMGMSNTAYQRAVQDMEAAGLNPMLAYSQGGASTPSPGQAPTPVSPMGGAMHSAADAASTIADLSVKGAQVEATKAGARLDNANAANIEWRNENMNPIDLMVRRAGGYAEVSKSQLDQILNNARWNYYSEHDYEKARAKAQVEWESEQADYALKHQQYGFRSEMNPLEVKREKYGLSESRRSSEAFESELGKYLPYAKYLGGFTGSAADVMRMFK